jgi:pimeloyl-ACP methyl ester carboxylesterase
MAQILGFEIFGKGSIPVIVLHDWYCDHSSWNPLLTYLNPQKFTYAFADLRGYGKSLKINGQYTLEEACSDVMLLADHLKWEKISLVGHSMSSVVAQRLGQLFPERIQRIAAITPVPPASLQCHSEAVEFFRAIALADDTSRFNSVSALWGTRLSEEWTRWKLSKWRETAAPQAVAKYVELWACTDISKNASEMKLPILIVAGEQDAPPFQPQALEKTMLPFYSNGNLMALSGSGHYPMQEQPPLLATMIERFLSV